MSTPRITTDVVAAFVANNDKQDVLLCSSEDGTHWSGVTKVGGEKSREAPAMVQFQSKLWMAFVADNSDRNILVTSSTDETGTSWSANRKIGQTTKAGPSLCVFRGKLWVAFIAKNSTNDILVCSSEDGVSWTTNTRVGQTSPHAPSLCVFNDRLWLAFAANDSHSVDKQTSDNPNTEIRRVLLCSSADGVKWSSYTDIGQTTKWAPSMCAFQDKLWIAFIASNPTNGILVCSSADGAKWSSCTGVNQSSQRGPSLAAVSTKMFLGFFSFNEKADFLVCTSTDGTNWSGNVKTGQRTEYTPCLLAREAVQGTVRPKFQVLTILYAPPGADGGKGASQVVYSNGSSAGTTHSISDSFKGSVEVTGRLGDDKATSAGGTFSFSDTVTDTSTIDVKKSETKTITVTGPSHDGINHDYDVFYVCLNPLYTITKTNGYDVKWELGIDGSEMTTMTLYAGWLNGNVKRPDQVASMIAAANLTEEDLAKILAANPFGKDGATGSTAIDSTRFVETGQGYSYLPPLASGDPVPLFSDRWENTTTTSQTHSKQLQYTASATFTQGAPGLWSLKETVGFQITHTNTMGRSSSTTQSAGFTIGGPSFNYTGTGTYLRVYWDTLFNTFMFQLTSAATTYSGSVSTQGGQPLSNQTVKLRVGGKVYTTTTDTTGSYRFAGTPTGSATITVQGKTVVAATKQSIKVG